MGGFDNRAGTLLHAGTRAQITAHTQRIVREAGAQGLILGADCSLPADIDLERIHWVIDALEQMGTA